MRQFIYVSTATAERIDIADILATSRVNNRRDGLSGLLYSDGKRFLQALEGEPRAIDAAYARIARDARHRSVVILSDREIDAREFGDWAMAHRAPGDDGAAFVARVAELVARASPNVQATFNGFAEVRRAA
ncbi:BLUF domain-containing protein [Sphingomonas donggukensis]|uniref:BLUF domain-containing protein n=1 Tax=Sphingomonas donggukensis TaxID=2949093 RepID=A0ABY4TV17_9SPHN|nr:BLUF domain-containing protein [Sphingomonas donggukensis]URW76238.1 BLUF domain-containing protein [Sphingomonas donggukensis]